MTNIFRIGVKYLLIPPLMILGFLFIFTRYTEGIQALLIGGFIVATSGLMFVEADRIFKGG